MYQLKSCFNVFIITLCVVINEINILYITTDVEAKLCQDIYLRSEIFY